MFLKVKEAHYLHDYQINLTFNDGTQGIVDLKDDLNGEVFEPLRALEVFSSVYLDETMKTLAWHNGADLAPEYLYFKAFRQDPALQAQFKAWGYC
jgi:hypothetical protein